MDLVATFWVKQPFAFLAGLLNTRFSQINTGSQPITINYASQKV